MHRASTGEDIADAALELSFDEIEEEFMNLELAQEAFQGTVNSHTTLKMSKIQEYLKYLLKVLEKTCLLKRSNFFACNSNQKL